MSLVIGVLLKTLNIHTFRKCSSLAIPVSKSKINASNEKKSLDSVFNTAEFTYFHVAAKEEYNKKDNGKSEQWGVTTTGNFDSERPCLILPESEFTKDNSQNS